MLMNFERWFKGVGPLSMLGWRVNYYFLWIAIKHGIYDQNQVQMFSYVFFSFTSTHTVKCYVPVDKHMHKGRGGIESLSVIALVL